jgi:hypothetical protein
MIDVKAAVDTGKYSYHPPAAQATHVYESPAVEIEEKAEDSNDKFSGYTKKPRKSTTTKKQNDVKEDPKTEKSKSDKDAKEMSQPSFSFAAQEEIVEDYDSDY